MASPAVIRSPTPARRRLLRIRIRLAPTRLGFSRRCRDGHGSGDARFFVVAQGQVCLNGPIGSGVPVPCSDPSAVTTVDENLGADHVANAIFFPEIQAILNTPGFGGYDVLQADIWMGCNAVAITGGVCPDGFVLNNGYDQAFIVATPQSTQVP